VERTPLNSRLKFLIRDYLRYGKAPRDAVSRLLEYRDILPGQGANEVAQSLLRLTHSSRLAIDTRSLAILESKIKEKMSRWEPNSFEWDRFFPNSSPQLIQKSIILKKPQPNGERGVLFVAWEDNWLRLLRYGNLEKLARDYHMVLSPTWSPPHDLPMLTACKLWPSHLFTILSNFEDAEIFPRLCSKIVVIPLLASSWVNPSIFKPTHTVKNKTFDIVVLSNFASYKRHMALFRILRDLKEETRVLLLGRSWEGRTAKTLKDEANLFGIGDRVEIKENLGDMEMIEAIQSAKVSFIASLREGSCVAVAESLFCDVPVALLEASRIGSKSMINANTGRLLGAKRVSEELGEFISHYRDYQPRKWMLQNHIDCISSSQKLNEEIKRWSTENGEPWTVDLQLMHWRPIPSFVDFEERSGILEEYSHFADSYGIPIELSS
jgi:glycosyltransferase involved in cell wall biosynthesis